MGKVKPYGSIEVEVSSKIALYTVGSGAEVYYRPVEFGSQPPVYQFSTALTAGKKSVLTPGTSYDKVRIDAGSNPVFYETGSDPRVDIQENAVNSVSFAAAAGGTNESDVTISFLDKSGAAVSDDLTFEWWLSDAATGLGLTGTTASGTVQAKSTEGTDLTVLTAKKHTISQTKTTAGTYVLEITDSAKTAFYVCVKNPVTGVIEVSDSLATADYG